jgi:hypothetical protein
MSPPGQRRTPGADDTSQGPSESFAGDSDILPCDSRSRECVWCGARTGTWLAICARCAVAVREGNARRRDAALRMPPLACGRRDPIGARGDAPHARGWAS